MAQTQDRYTKVFFSIDGAIMLTAQSVTISHESGAQPVNTIAGGYVGTTDGIGMCNFSVEAAIGEAGFEVELTKYLEANALVTVEFEAGGLKCTIAKATIPSQSIQMSAGANAALSFSGYGKFSKFS